MPTFVLISGKFKEDRSFSKKTSNKYTHSRNFPTLISCCSSLSNSSVHVAVENEEAFETSEAVDERVESHSFVKSYVVGAGSSNRNVRFESVNLDSARVCANVCTCELNAKVHTTHTTHTHTRTQAHTRTRTRTYTQTYTHPHTRMRA